MSYQLPSPYREVHQSRRRVPTAFEDRLADALELAFAEGAWDLEELIGRLNSLGSTDSEGQAWTQESFTRQLAEIAVDAVVPEVEE